MSHLYVSDIWAIAWLDAHLLYFNSWIYNGENIYKFYNTS